MALNERTAKAVKWNGKDKTYGDGNGLYLLVRRSSKTWIIRRRHNGKNTITTLGKYPQDYSVMKAREKAITTKRAHSPTSITVSDLADKYEQEIIKKEHRRPELSAGYIRRAINPVLGKRKVQDITRAHIAEMVQDYSARGNRTADQLRSVTNKIFEYAVELGIIDHNPAALISRRVAGYKPVARDRVLSDKEIRAIWDSDQENARMLRFLLLTGVRVGEARFGEPWLAGNKWTIPAEISKNKKELHVYLTELARDQLHEPFNRSLTGTSAWTRNFCNRNEYLPHFTPHDMRRTFATRLNDAGIAPHIVERCLNHTLQGVMAVYNRAEYWEERVDALKTMEQIIKEIVKTR